MKSSSCSTSALLKFILIIAAVSHASGHPSPIRFGWIPLPGVPTPNRPTSTSTSTTPTSNLPVCGTVQGCLTQPCCDIDIPNPEIRVPCHWPITQPTCQVTTPCLCDPVGA